MSLRTTGRKVMSSFGACARHPHEAAGSRRKGSRIISKGQKITPSGRESAKNSVLGEICMIDSVQGARRGLAIYFSILIPGSAFLEWLLLRTGDPIEKHHGFVFVLMWIPAIASLVARTVLSEGIRDISFRFGGVQGAKAMLIAWVYPLAVG